MSKPAPSDAPRLGAEITSVDTFLEFAIEVGLGLTGTTHARRLWRVTPGMTMTVHTKPVDVTGQFPTIRFRHDDDESQRRDQMMTLIDGLLYHQRKFALETPGGSTIRFAIEAVRDEAEPVKLYAVSPRERVLPKSQTGQPVSHWPHFWLAVGGLVAASLIAVGGIAVWYYQFR